jgi:hypothetical protein
LRLWLANRIWFAVLPRTLPAGFIAPCLPTKTDKLPSGSRGLHEIKHDGFRVIAARVADSRCTRPGGHSGDRKAISLISTKAELN